MPPEIDSSSIAGKSFLSIKDPRDCDGCCKQEERQKDEADSPVLQPTAIEQVSTTARETFSEALWKENLDLAEQAWNTQYIKGIASGTLDPRDFGHYTVQDAAYCNASTHNLKFLMDTIKHRSLRQFFEGQYKDYKKYTQDLYDQWFLKPDGADLGEAAQWYVNLENKVAHEEGGPLYYLVAMIPCLRLWPYLANKMKRANKMKDEGDDKDSNIYKFWIDENDSYQGAEEVEAVVNAYSSLIDRQKASKIYRECMYGEVNFFRSDT
uniref:Thiaminase-2/PQQC domain-containing protein n=1 Tax=Branchiostoma floridae TaxID=7739 RepID=C3YPV3_BRAFL|eukprot:XP_002601875.1 hypothetical protein BRAFLDRAFT_75908 [Branchiostoma floridae]